MSIVSEALLAASGLFPTRLTRTVVTAAEAIPREFRRGVRDFFDASGPRKFKRGPRLDWESTWGRLSAGVGGQELEALVVGLPDALAIDYGASLSSAREYLKARWPALSIESPTGPRLLEPSTMELGAAWELYGIIDSPLRILGELSSGALSGPQAEAVAKAFPNISMMLRAQIQEDIERRVRAKKSYRVAWWQERVLRVLLGMPERSVIGVVAPKHETMSMPNVKIDYAGVTTKAQRLASDRSGRAD